MTPKRYPLEAGNIAPRIIAWFAADRTLSDVRSELSTRRKPVSVQALSAFRKRHKDEIAAERAKLGEKVAQAVEAEILAPTIAEKSVRIQHADVAAAEIMKWIATYGLITTIEHHGVNDTYVENKFNGDVVRSLVTLLRYVSDEKGEMPKPGINIAVGDTMNVNVLNLDAYTPEQKAALLRLALRGLPS